MRAKSQSRLRQDLASYKQLVAETGALFGARHYEKYHFLWTLSDQARITDWNITIQ